MLKRFFSIGFIFVIAVVALSSCNKVEDNIHRAWLRESMEAGDNSEIIWEFKDDGSPIRLYNAGEATDTAYFTIEKKTLYTEIKIIEAGMFSGGTEPNGFFRVEEISDSKLVLTRYELLDESTEGAYLREEFTSLD